jgi:hypothetical protein
VTLPADPRSSAHAVATGAVSPPTSSTTETPGNTIDPDQGGPG